jgi:hypothetical protein
MDSARPEAQSPPVQSPAGRCPAISHEFSQRFIAELRRAADALPAERDTLAAARKAVAGKIANLLRLAEKTPDSASVAARLRELEEQ